MKGPSTRPSLGGIVIGLWGWRWIFILNCLVAALGFTTSHWIIPSDRGKGKVKKFDGWGSFYVIVGMVSFIYAISNLNDFGWSSPTILISFTFFLLSVIAVAVQERRAESPSRKAVRRKRPSQPSLKERPS